jgi:hypothetical protein
LPKEKNKEEVKGKKKVIEIYAAVILKIFVEYFYWFI